VGEDIQLNSFERGGVGVQRGNIFLKREKFGGNLRGVKLYKLVERGDFKGIGGPLFGTGEFYLGRGENFGGLWGFSQILDFGCLLLGKGGGLYKRCTSG